MKIDDFVMEKDTLYFCDPTKNKNCTKESCYMCPTSFGDCRFTFNPEYSKDGKKYYYDEYTHRCQELPEIEVE